MLTWGFLFLWENRKRLKINKVSYQLSRVIFLYKLIRKQGNVVFVCGAGFPDICDFVFTKTQKALSLLVNTYKQYS